MTMSCEFNRVSTSNRCPKVRVKRLVVSFRYRVRVRVRVRIGVRVRVNGED
jgi:hypothetical protein